MTKKQQEPQKKEVREHKESNAESYKLQLETYVNDLKRLQADFENYKKRSEKENHDFKEYCNKEIIIELLTLMDDFDHCINGMNKASKEDIEKSMKMLSSKLKSLLEKHHVRSFNSLNEKFDPFKHEVLMKQDSEKEDIVLEEYQKGYFYKDKILRHAKVKIAKKSEVKNDEGPK